jgi:hypothetical protein
MPKSNGRPLNRRRKTPRLNDRKQVCSCGGVATKYGKCVRCLDDPTTRLILQASGIYLPSRKERILKWKMMHPEVL